MLCDDVIPISQMIKLKLRQMNIPSVIYASIQDFVLHLGAFDVFMLNFIAFIVKTLGPLPQTHTGLGMAWVLKLIQISIKEACPSLPVGKGPYRPPSKASSCVLIVTK